MDLEYMLGRLFGRGQLGERKEMGGFGKQVHYCQDGGVAIRRVKTRDEVQGYV